MSANLRQVGGDHYKKDGGEEHWDRQWRLYGRGYFVGCITKYVERYPEKNGVQDLEKAIHFIEKLIELEKASQSGDRKWLIQGVANEMEVMYTCKKCGFKTIAVSMGQAEDEHNTLAPSCR